MVPFSKFTYLAKGKTKGYDQLSQQLQQRLEKGDKIANSQQEYIDGLALLEQESKKAPEERAHLLQHFVKDGSTKKVHKP